MISKRTKTLVRFRIAVVRFFFNALINWDYREDKCKLTHNYIFFIWCSSYYSGISGLPLLFGVLYLNIIELQEEQENDENDEKGDTITRIYKNLGISFNALITGAIIFCSLIVSILKQMKHEVCAFYNACFQLDTFLKGKELIKNKIEKKLCIALVFVIIF